MTVPFVDLHAQMADIRDEVDAAIAGVLNRGDYILGSEVEEFEREFASFCDVRHGIGVDSGTSGLELALLAYDIGPGDEVITVANTFIATVLAISATGATPVLVDMDEATYGIDVTQIESAITPATKAIIPVHLYGQPADMDPILELAKEHGLKVIEDASQAHGARYKGRRVGSIGDIAVFSLYPAKNLGGIGDAGVIVTNDAAVAERLRLLRNYGSETKYVHKFRGFNRRLDTLQAAVLRIKLRHLDKWNQARRDHAGYYTTELSKLSGGVVPPGSRPDSEPVYHLYVVRVEDRAGFQAHLADKGITTLVHYPIPIHLQEAYADLDLGRGAFPVTERCADEIVSLPMYAELDRSLIDEVVSAIDSYLG